MATIFIMIASSFTSCEGTLDDVFGEWDKPTPASPNSTPSTDPTPVYNAKVTPLTFESKDANSTITVLIKTDMATGKDIQYSVDDEEWVTAHASDTGGNIDACTAPVSITGHQIRFRGDNDSYFDTSTLKYTKLFVSDGNCYIYGNVMSLINSTEFENLTSFNTDLIDPLDATSPQKGYGAFRHFLAGYLDGTVKNPIELHPEKELVLPATTLSNACYMGMFHMTDLKSAPALPATTMADYCYHGMFNACASLVSAPVLPAETLAKWCYTNMFRSCTNLTSVPSLSSVNLEEHCYEGMFSSCSNLTTAPDLPATTLQKYCYQSMFSDCSKLTTAPDLPATVLVEGCYMSMFSNCSHLNSVTCKATSLGALTNPYEATLGWLSSVAASGTLYRPATMSFAWLTNSADGIPTGWSASDI